MFTACFCEQARSTRWYVCNNFAAHITSFPLFVPFSNVTGGSDRKTRLASHARPIMVCSSEVRTSFSIVVRNLMSCVSCATTGEGLFEGLQWLSQNVKKRQT